MGHDREVSTKAKASRHAAAGGKGPTGDANGDRDPERARIAEVLRRLRALYPNPRTELSHRTPFQLLVATILSAQATDRSVNLATPALFARYPDADALARAEPEDLYPLIGKIGLYRNKARSLVGAARMIRDRFGSRVPRDRESLMALPGVGRKTANVVMSNAFGIPAIAVDTHVFRVSRRLGLASGNTPERVEAQLRAIVPREDWSDAHHWLIFHGRRVCSARRPGCQACGLADVCPSAGNAA